MSKEILPLSRNKDQVLKRLKGVPDSRPRPVVPVGTQVQRIGPDIERKLSNILDRDDIKLADDPSALAPERALGHCQVCPWSDDGLCLAHDFVA